MDDYKTITDLLLQYGVTEVTEEHFLALASHPAVLLIALSLCAELGKPPPEWVLRELNPIIERDGKLRPSRGTRSAHERLSMLVVDSVRFAVVQKQKKSGATYREAFQAAADEINIDSGSPEIGGSDEGMRSAHRRFSKFIMNADLGALAVLRGILKAI